MAEKKDNDEEEVTVVEEDQGPATAVQKAKQALKACEKERKEYLDGWKRSKADALNEQKRQQKLLEAEQAAALGRYAAAMLPVLDSIRMALGEQENAGMERIHTQCLQSFKSVGIDICDPLGEPFDPARHQSVGERPVTDSGQVNTVVEVVRVGALAGDTVVRAALVYVGAAVEK